MNTLSSFFRQLSNSYIIVLKVNIWKLYFFHLMIWVRFILIIWQPILKFFCFVYFLVVFNIDFDDFISLELTRVNLDRNIFSIKCGTNIYFFFTLQRFGPCIIITEFKKFWLLPTLFLLQISESRNYSKTKIENIKVSARKTWISHTYS